MKLNYIINIMQKATYENIHIIIIYLL